MTITALDTGTTDLLAALDEGVLTLTLIALRLATPCRAQ